MATVLAASLSGPAGGREGVAPSVDLRSWIERLVKEHGGSPSWGEKGRLVVLWGGAKARESDPERATRAALALRDGMRDLREKGRHAQTVRIGIGTGSAFRGADAASGGGSMGGAAVTELLGEEAPEGDAPASAYPPLPEVARERQLIFPAKSSSFEASQEYSFKRALLRDIAYETVVKTMRRAYHAGAAR